jgi:hypothetical protein
MPLSTSRFASRFPGRWIPLTLLAIACGGETITTPLRPPPVPTAIILSTPTVTLTSLGEAQIVATVEDQHGATLATTVTWRSDSDAIAAVSGDGTVTAVGNGTTTITATAGPATATASVTVNLPVVQAAPSSGYRLGYGTFVGGSGEEELREPILLTGGRLLFGGRTESANAATTVGAFQRTFGGTSDSYLAILSADGARLEAATYFGGSGFERPPYGTAIAANGDFVFTSGTSSPNLPTTSGAYRRSVQVPFVDPGDGYVCRISPNLRTMRWCTYTGGGWPRGGLTLDPQDNVIVVGDVRGSQFTATGGVVQPLARGTNDAFLLKLASTGTRAIWATRLGGSASSAAQNVEVALSAKLLPNGEVSVIGVSYSTNFPTVAGAPQRVSTGTSDVFIARLNSTATTLMRSTLLGGSGDEGPSHAQSLLSDGSVIISGVTASPSLPGATGSRRGLDDGFVAKLNVAGTAFDFVRLIGGSGTEVLLGPVIGPTGLIYIVGGTTSVNFPVTADALQPTYGGGAQDGVVLVLNPNGSIRYASYLGGPGSELIRGVAVGPSGEMYVVGRTDSNSFPVTAGAHKTKRSGIDGFVVKMVPR